MDTPQRLLQAQSHIPISSWTADGDSSLIPVTAAILTGGLPSAARGPVAQTPAEVHALVRHLAGMASRACLHVSVVADSTETFAGSGLAGDVIIVENESGHGGLLAELATALDSGEDEWVLAIGADAPWLRPGHIRSLWDVRSDAQVVMPVSERGAEPIVALYRKDCLPAVMRTLASGRRRISSVLPSVAVVEVPLDLLDSGDVSVLPGAVRRRGVEAVAGSAIPERRQHSRPTVVRAGEDGQLSRLPAERPITVHMNGIEIATVQGSPKDLEEMAAGFLLAEGLVDDRAKLIGIDVDSRRGLVYVDYQDPLPDEFIYRKRYITSGCGKGVTFSSVGHARGLDPVTSEITVFPADLLSLVRQLSQDGTERKETAGVHGCGFGAQGTVISIREDIGRHNAVDKLIGRAWLDRLPTDDLVLISTGRVSYEMAVKAAKARVPVVVSRHGITDLAAEIATELGITMIAYCRGNRMVVLTHPERVASEDLGELPGAGGWC